MESNKEEKIKTVSEENIYKLNGRVPLRKAIPFGLQHVLAMFVSNLAPVLIVCSAAVLRSNGAHLSSAEITQLLQCAMFVAGIGTCLQLYPIRTSDYYGSQFYVSWKSVGHCNESGSGI